jgi:hypothetical protein
MGSEELERVFAILEEDGIRVVRKPDRKHPFFITERALPGGAKEIVIWPAKLNSIGTLATAVSLSGLEWGPHLSRYSGAAFYALVHDGTESGMAVRRVTAFQGLFSSESHHFVLAEPKINLIADWESNPTKNPVCYKQPCEPAGSRGFGNRKLPWNAENQSGNFRVLL